MPYLGNRIHPWGYSGYKSQQACEMCMEKELTLHLRRYLRNEVWIRDFWSTPWKRDMFLYSYKGELHDR